MTTSRWLTPLIVTASMAFAVPATADAVADWNQITLDTIAAAGPAARPGPSSIIDLATVHVAVYDAVVAIEGRFKPYHVHVPGAQGSSAAAAAKAARDVLVNRFPAQTAALDAKYAVFLANNGLTPDDPGVAVGAAVAAHIIALRATDGAFPATFPPFVGGLDPGEWRPTPNYLPVGNPPPPAPMAVPWLGSVTPFTLKSSDQLRPGPPPALTSGKYTRDYNEVKALGKDTGGTRTPEQTDLAYFYAGNFAAQYYRVARNLTSAHHIADSARLFALMSAAAADSIIGSWDAKRFFNFWRPVTAIQEGENDGNNRTEGDPDWKPLINTPPYPDYTSGANNITGSMMRALALFFGTDDMEFDVTTEVPQATTKTRHYTRFSAVADDVVEARIFLGIHFRTADVVARRTGQRAAQWAFSHFFRPNPSGDGDKGRHGHDVDDLEH